MFRERPSATFHTAIQCVGSMRGTLTTSCSPFSPRTLVVGAAALSISFLQSAINMARAATLWNVAANIDEIILFATFGANIRWLCGGYKKSTLGAFPIGQTTIGTNISHEPAVGCVATKCTYICFRFVFHFFYLFPLIYPYAWNFLLSGHRLIHKLTEYRLCFHIDFHSFIYCFPVHGNGINRIAHPDGLFKGLLVNVSAGCIPRSLAHMDLVMKPF